MNSAINTPWKKAVRAEAGQGYRLHVVMDDGEELDVDLTPLMTTREPFWRLRNFTYFRNVAVDPLGVLCWPGGEDIAPTKISEYVLDRSGR